MTPWATTFLAIDGRLTVIDAVGSDGGWAERVRAALPDVRVDALDAGMALDRAVAELGLRHVNYLRVADEAALPILSGAQSLLRYTRIDIVEIVGNATDSPALATVGPLLQDADFLLL